MGVPPAKLHEKPAEANKSGTQGDPKAGFFDPVMARHTLDWATDDKKRSSVLPWVLNGFGGTRPGEAFPVGQTLGQTASFRQTAPETWSQSRVCGVSRHASPKTVKHPFYLARPDAMR